MRKSPSISISADSGGSGNYNVYHSSGKTPVPIVGGTITTRTNTQPTVYQHYTGITGVAAEAGLIVGSSDHIDFDAEL
jgi:hypothetical protein